MDRAQSHDCELDRNLSHCHNGVLCTCRMATEEDLEKFRKECHVAFVVGYTGETGKELVKALSATKPFTRVVLIGRRKTSVTDKLGEGFVSSDSKHFSIGTVRECVIYRKD